MQRIHSFLIAVILFTACGAPQKEEVSGIITERAKARIDSTLRAMVDASKIAGASALIVENDKEVYFNAFGKADIEAGRPFDRNTIVRIYSMTKPITGVALMQLYEKGAFQLDDPLSKYAPEFADVKVFSGTDPKGKMILLPPKRAITVRDITRHTAGFAPGDHPVLGPIMKEARLLGNESTLTKMATGLAKIPLAYSPGEQWAYGISVDVQAYLVEKLSGKPFDQYVRENILDPLKMTSTRYVPVDTTRFAHLYRDENGMLNPIGDPIGNDFNLKDWPMKPGGFGLTSTVDDYMRFARMLLHEGTFDGVTILKPETVKLMATNQLADSVKQRMWLPKKGQVGFGIDFAVRLRAAKGPEEKVGAVGEFFWDGAASTLFWVDPKNKLTVVLFTQIFPFSDDLHKNFRDAVYGKFTPAK